MILRRRYAARNSGLCLGARRPRLAYPAKSLARHIPNFHALPSIWQLGGNQKNPFEEIALFNARYDAVVWCRDISLIAPNYLSDAVEKIAMRDPMGERKAHVSGAASGAVIPLRCRFHWWARQGSNLQPDRYERSARPGSSFKCCVVCCRSGMVVRVCSRGFCGVPEGRRQGDH